MKDDLKLRLFEFLVAYDGVVWDKNYLVGFIGLLSCHTYTANPFPVKFFHREIPVTKTGVPAMRTGIPCNENRLFLMWKTSQGKPCSGPVLALYGIAVYNVVVCH